MGVITTAFGTTFVVVSTDREVVLGIDTKRGHQRNGRIVSDSQVCKVVTRKSSAYALAGDTGIANGPDAYPLVNSLATDDVTATMQAVELPLRKFLKERLLPKMSAGDLRPLIQTQVPIAVIIGIEFKQKGNMRDLSFFVNQDHTIRSVPTSYSNPGYFDADSNHEIAKARPLFWYNETDLTGLVRKLLDAGIKASPADSGYPISIIAINRYGLDQPERPETCKTMDVAPGRPANRRSKKKTN